MTCQTKEAAIYHAARKEAQTRRTHYVMHCTSGGWLVTERMPLLGEWYTSDGIRHG